MTNFRSILLIAWLLVAGWLLLQWTEWNAAPAAPVGSSLPAGAAPAAGTPTASNLPAAATALPGATPSPTAPTLSAAPVLRLRNDVLDVSIDAHGNVVRSRLLAYHQEKKAESPLVELLGPAAHYSASSGLFVADGNVPRVVEPTFAPVGAADVALPAGGKQVVAELAWTDPSTGLSIHRTYTMQRGSYVIEVADTLANTGTGVRRVWPYVELERTAPPPAPKFSGMRNPEAFSFLGAAWYSPEDKFEKKAFKDFADAGALDKSVTGGWIAMLQHHFLAAWVPDPKEKQLVKLETGTTGSEPLYRIRSVALPVDLAPGKPHMHTARLWVGPKLQAQLDQVAPDLKRSLDYGTFHFIAQPLFDYVLKPLHALTGNWGWAIVLTVLLLKLALYKVSKAQFKSMARIRAVQPRVEALKERYGEDRQAFNMAMMELYKKEGINPAGGCLPVLIPLPIFFALYWVLIETVELRQAAWIGWIQNLSAPDPYFILPAINLAVMYVTQRMSPTPGMDPVQKKMMQFMPLVFGVMMAFFPAGLVLYWVTNGALGLLQQWWITRRHGQATGAHATVR
jgi:YidC/Oxa1 family membrane protein insertase